MNLHVPPELEAKLTRLAAETGRTVDQVALELLRARWTTTNGSGAKSRRAGSPPVKADCSTTRMSPLGWTGAIVADARPLDGRCR
jgi:hypothetical protein